MRKTIIIATGILVFILLILIIISNASRSKQQVEKNNLLTPTTVQVDSLRILNENEEKLLAQAQSLAPYETENFRYSFSEADNLISVEEKTPQGKADFNQWLVEKNIQGLIDNNLIIYKTASSSSFEYYNDPNNNFILNFFNIFSSINENLRKGNGEPALSPTEIPNNTFNSTPNNISGTNNPPSTNLTYYGQGTEPYATIKLPPNCILRGCGCGPTSVAMIASSYLSTDYDPQKIVDIYNKNGYNSCCGSSITDAKSVLEELGLKTTDLIIYEYPPVSANQVTPQFKKYLNAGWTIMVLAYYKPNQGGGHYFWITDIDNNGNILAYDPWYGQGNSAPINENQYSPFPEYAQAFAVKKN